MKGDKLMPRKKKEDTTDCIKEEKEEKKEVKTTKYSPYGWEAIQAKARLKK